MGSTSASLKKSKSSRRSVPQAQAMHGWQVACILPCARDKSLIENKELKDIINHIAPLLRLFLCFQGHIPSCEILSVRINHLLTIMGSFHSKPIFEVETNAG